MGWPPAVIIVVRHGARLDQADKQWHLTSPTPYDPPLTYGGWMQSRAVGAKIASILRSREEDDHDSLSKEHAAILGEGLFQRKRKHKVIIHSSPFLRCVQTSIAISSGLAQHPAKKTQDAQQPHRRSLLPGDAAKVYHAHAHNQSIPALSIGPPVLGAPRPASAKINDVSQSQHSQIPKTMLRVDAFLGEWLSPEYFEMITPPPNSIMMVARAKADLLRREDYNSLTEFRKGSAGSPIQGFPGGWGSPMTAPITAMDVNTSSKATSSAVTSPTSTDRIDKVNEDSEDSEGTETAKNSPQMPQGNFANQTVYRPPIPSYAISVLDPIPAGYVSHARDACVDIDYQWDSMREPHNWGDGGQYGEEWSRMHSRFRKGLNSLLHWYRDHDNPAKPATRRPSTAGLGLETGSIEDQDDSDTDLVLVLVTHGAGCNALIGALTNQPVLLDVGMASLTMAVRKDNVRRPSVVGPCDSPTLHAHFSTASFDPSDEYEVSMVANKDHLRPSPSGNSLPVRSSQGGSTSIWRRPNHTSRASPDLDGTRPHSISIIGNYGAMRRTGSTASTGSLGPRAYKADRKNSAGLWSPRSAEEDEETSPGDDLVLNFGDGSSASAAGNTTGTWLNSTNATNTSNDLFSASRSATALSRPSTGTRPGTANDHGAAKGKVGEKLKEEEGEVVTPLGLWGSSNPFSFSDKARERNTTPKRRWTMDEQASPTMAP